MARNIKGSIVLDPQATAPTSPVEGEQYYDSTDDTMKVYNGSEWQYSEKFIVGSTLTTSNISVATTATLIKAANTDRLRLLIYNNSDKDVYIGIATVTTSTGFKIASGEAYEYSDTEAIYGIQGDTGTKDIRYLEVAK